MATAADERRGKISVSVDPDLLRAVDAFIQQHPETTRSGVVDEALWLWRQRQRDDALIRQYTTPLTPEQESEQAAWNEFHRAATEGVLARADDRYTP